MGFNQSPAEILGKAVAYGDIRLLDSQCAKDLDTIRQKLRKYYSSMHIATECDSFHATISQISRVRKIAHDLETASDRRGPICDFIKLKGFEGYNASIARQSIREGTKILVLEELARMVEPSLEGVSIIFFYKPTRLWELPYTSLRTLLGCLAAKREIVEFVSAHRSWWQNGAEHYNSKLLMGQIPRG
jgi:hypothetical protein